MGLRAEIVMMSSSRLIADVTPRTILPSMTRCAHRDPAMFGPTVLVAEMRTFARTYER